MALASKTLSIIAVLGLLSQQGYAQNPPTNYTAATTPYDGTETWYCEKVSGTSNKSCSFANLIASITSLANLTSAASLTTTGIITSGGLGTGAQVTMGGLTYNGTNGIPLNQLPTSLATLPLVIAQGGTGTNTPALVAGNGIAITNAWPNQTITASTGAAAQNSTVGNPAGTTSLTGVMAGIGSGCSITPTKTGTVFFEISGPASNNTTADGVAAELRTGTGTAPVNAAAPAGTVTSNTPFFSINSGGAASLTSLIVLHGVRTGLALGTAVWFDLKELAITGGTATFTNLTCSAMEQ